MTSLLLVAHGTRRLLGNAVASIIAKQAGCRLGMESRAAYVELCEPLFADVVAEARQSTLVVPLLLSTGYHVRVDLPAAVATAAAPVSLGTPLGPDPLLASAQVSRLVAAGASPGQPVVLVAAGSNDPAARADIAAAGSLLADAWGAPVRVATISGSGAPALDEVVRPGDAVSPYLLAPGLFSETVRTPLGDRRGRCRRRRHRPTPGRGRAGRTSRLGAPRLRRPRPVSGRLTPPVETSLLQIEWPRRDGLGYGVGQMRRLGGVVRSCSRR